ncbi:PLC-like phosphodiesterase [Serendipita vermifera]|nr:PLC-like phosphodiesterase [Serendipita vermifera]
MFGELVITVHSLLRSLVSFFLHSPLLMADTDRMAHHLKRGTNLLGELEKTGPKTDWMSHVKDTVPLCRMTIPGTHDAAAYNYTGPDHIYWNCQSLPLFRQLDAGIRALDLRYNLRNGKLNFFHSEALLDENAEVEDIIWGLKAWLELHPTETIFVSLKVDKVGEGNSQDDQTLKDLIGEVLTHTQAFWVDNPVTTTTLKEARGKLVLLRRFDFDRPAGFDLSQNWAVNFYPSFKIILDKEKDIKAQIEDFYLLKKMPGDAARQVSRKKEAVDEHLDRAANPETPTDLWITFSSAVGDRHKKGEDVTPRVMALGREDIAGINSHLRDWCKRQTTKTPVGIILMDFVTMLKEPSTGQTNDVASEDDDLIQLLIDRNITA